MFNLDAKQQHNNITLTADKDLPYGSQTNMHSNSVPRHDSFPNNKQPSKALPLDKNHFSSLFIHPRIKSLRKQGMGDDLNNTQYDLHYELLLMSVPGGGGGGLGGKRGLGGSPMEGMFVEMDRGGSGVLTHGKRQSTCVLSELKFAYAFVQANRSFLFTF